MRLGYRESSPPFSFLDHSNRPIGYSLELCEAIVEEIGVEVDDANLKVEYVKVTSDDRIPAVVQNKIDLECGSTTANAERAKLVAFSPLMFVAGTKLMVPKASTISAPTDLKGKTVVVTKGTTNEQAMHAIDKKFSLGLNIVTSPDHEQSYQMLVDGKADAFATDDILLYGLIARHKAQDKFKVTGEYLSYDPYGIMFRKGEPQLKAVVERTFRKLGSGRDLIPLYNKWFVARLPTGEKLGVSISPQLEEAFKVLDDTQGKQLGVTDRVIAGEVTASSLAMQRHRTLVEAPRLDDGDDGDVSEKLQIFRAAALRDRRVFDRQEQPAGHIDSSLLRRGQFLARPHRVLDRRGDMNVRRGIGARAPRRRCPARPRPCDGPRCR